VNLTVQDLLSLPSISRVGFDRITPIQNFRDVSTDSRSLRRDDLFVALRGEKFDGHEYLDQVKKEGALAAIVDKHWFKKNERKAKSLEMPLLVVEDTLQAYGGLASLYRRKFNIPVLVIAGSNGKTTAKELIAYVLSSTLEVLKTEANYNNQVGVPRMLFRLRDGHDIAVLEIGTNHPGEIEWLCSVAQPTHALVTNIGREHLEFFKDLKGVTKEECTALEFVHERAGFAFINLDDKFIRPYAKSFADKQLNYGVDPTAQVTVHSMGHAKDGRLELRITAEGKSFRLRTHLLADYAPNLLGSAVAVGLHFKLRRAEIKQMIEHFKPHDKRLELMTLPSGLIILNDTYNANPDSMESAFRTVSGFPHSSKKYAALGDMLELGESASKEHRGLGKLLVESKFQHIYFAGTMMEAAYRSFLRAGGAEKRATWTNDKDAIAEQIKEAAKPGDVVLVKGSRGMKMEDVIEGLQK